jgi:hypothetical protein
MEKSMGHKTGLKAADAQGRVVPLDRKGVDEAFEQGQRLDLAELAQSHTADAIKTLVTVMKSRKSAANAKVSAATRLLEFAHGRAAQSVNHTGQQQGGLTINILRMSDGKGSERVLDAVDVAKEMLEGGFEGLVEPEGEE